MVSNLHVARQTVLMQSLVLLWLYLEERSHPLASVNIPIAELEPYDSSEDEDLNEH